MDSVNSKARAVREGGSEDAHTLVGGMGRQGAGRGQEIEAGKGQGPSRSNLPQILTSPPRYSSNKLTSHIPTLPGRW